MDRLWDWHQNGRRIDDVDGFIAGLQKANKQKDLLLKHQMLTDGDVVRSVSMLFALAKQKPQSTDKVVTAALEMDKYFRLYYKHSKNEMLETEKLSLPAMLEVIKPQILKTVKDPQLVKMSNVLISRAKGDLTSDVEPTRRNKYDCYFSTYQQIMAYENKPAQHPASHCSKNNKELFTI